MDVAVCPKCRTSSLIEIKTSDTPVKKAEDKVITELSHMRQRRISGKASAGDGNSPTFNTYHHTRNTSTRDEDQDNEHEFGLCNQYKTSSDTKLTVVTSMPSKSATTLHATSKPHKASPVTFDASLTLKKSSAGPDASHSLKSRPESCTAADWEKEIGFLNIPKASPTVCTAADGFSGKYDQVVSTASRYNYGKVTFALPKGESEARVTKAACGNVVQHMADQGSLKTKCKLVDSEAQTDIVAQVLEAPMHSHPVTYPAQQQRQVSQRSGYMYQPKRPVDGEKETSILKAAIKRSIAQGWHREMDKLNDLCLSDR